MFFKKIPLVLSGVLCISLSASVRAEADSFTELLESAASLYRSVKSALDSIAVELDARDAAAAEADAADVAAVADSAVAAPSATVPVPAEPAAVAPVPVDTAVAAAVPVDSAVVVADTAAASAVVADTAVTAATPAVAAPVKKAEKPPKPPKMYPIAKPDIEMIFVKGGKFKMGCNANEEKHCISDERPVHEIKIGNYYIGKYPVTQKQWGSVMGVSPAHFDGDDLPVEQVSWDEAQEFIRRLNAMTGKKYRLPTEAEWEYAALGGANATGRKFSGHRFLDDVAWYEYNSDGRTRRVGAKQPNELGVYDMIGNVWEWVNDWYDKYYYRGSPVNNPQGPKRGDERMYRGGAFGSYEEHCRISLRNYNKPGYRTINLGFRLACTQ